MATGNCVPGGDVRSAWDVDEPKYRRALRYYYHRAFPRHQKPAPVAWSVFWGVFIGVLPTLGIAVGLTMLVTALFRLPKTPGVVASFIAIPPTLFFFFYPVGYFLVGVPIVQPAAIDYDFLDVFGSLTLGNLGEVGSMLWRTASGHVKAFLVGMTIVATITGALCFALTMVIMRRREARRLAARAARIAAREAAAVAAATPVPVPEPEPTPSPGPGRPDGVAGA